MKMPVKQKPYLPDRFILPAILIITAVVFANTCSNSFIENLDDNVYILGNQFIRHLDWHNLKEIFSVFFQGNYHPVTLLSYAIEYKFFGLNPFVFHLTNYILHLLNTLLVYWFIKQFTGKIWVAAITALFFGIHPMHVESVAWISERKDVLYTFFFLLSLISYVKYLSVEKKNSYLVWTFLWFLLSLLSKPAAVCLPFVLILLDYYRYRKISRQMVINKITFFLLAIIFGVITIFSQHSFQDNEKINQFYTVFDRIFLVSYSIAFYLVKAFIPFHFSVMYYYPVKSGNMLPTEYYATLPVLFLLIWGVLKSGRFKKELVFGLLFYFITIALELQILPAGQVLVSERYSYIPYIGIFFIAGQLYVYVKENKLMLAEKIKPVFMPLLILMAIIFSLIAYQRNKVWKNGEVLFTDVVTKYPQYSFGWYTLGNSENSKGDYDAAIINYTKAIELSPTFTDVYLNRGNSEFTEKNLDAAIADYSKVIELAPNTFLAYLDRGLVEDAKENPDAAIADYTKAIQLDSSMPDTNSENRKKNLDAAIADYTKTIELVPAYTDAYINRGNSEKSKGEGDAAIRDYSKAIELSPNIFSPYFDRGLIEEAQQNYSAAITDYTKAIELSPNFAPAYYYRGLTELGLNQKDKACRDWQLAQQYGSPLAADARRQYCK